MTKNNSEHRQPDHVAEKQSPNYRSKNTPRAEHERKCHHDRTKAAPSSAAENHEDANQKCETPAPKPRQKTSAKKPPANRRLHRFFLGSQRTQHRLRFSNR